MSETDKHCKSCRFFDKGHCRRYPPRAAQVGEPGRARWVQHLPIVNEDDYCGEFERGAKESKSKSAIDSIPSSSGSKLFRTVPESV
ncbi:MAG: hypothetical protein U9Q07_10725 [Planctomycetota bacterium]|nr:hypothetical protein [Planctomycetota bacterium]